MQQPSPANSIAIDYFDLPAFRWLCPAKGRATLHIFRKRRSVQKTAVRATCTSSVDLREDDIFGFRTTGRKDPPGSPRHHQIPQIPREPVMGIEPMTPVLPRLCATAAPHGPTYQLKCWYWWAVEDSNLRSFRN